MALFLSLLPVTRKMSITCDSAAIISYMLLKVKKIANTPVLPPLWLPAPKLLPTAPSHPPPMHLIVQMLSKNVGNPKLQPETFTNTATSGVGYMGKLSKCYYLFRQSILKLSSTRTG